MDDLISRFIKHSDLHQSPMHADVMREIGWEVDGVAGSQLFYRSLGPLTIAKIQRPKTLNLQWINRFRKSHKTLTTYIEPSLSISGLDKIKGFSVEPFAHSCTSLIDLLPSDAEIIKSFSQKTRYNIVHTLKKDQINIETIPLKDLTSSQKEAFLDLHDTWSKKKNVVGYPLSLLNAIIKCHKNTGDLHFCYLDRELVGALLILYHDQVATYYAAFALYAGYTTFAPTLLTWSAIQTAKLRGCEIFDFGGIYDPRYPKMYKRWQGFTKFKSGFNPTVVSYPPTTLQLFW